MSNSSDFSTPAPHASASEQPIVSQPSSQPSIDRPLTAPAATHQRSVVILGRGAWGTALAALVTKAGHLARSWSRQEEATDTGRLATIVPDAAADVIVSAVSMKGVVEVAQRLQLIGLPTTTILVTATKGLEAATSRTASQIWQEAFPQNPIVVLSGPNLSEEIVQELPTATVVSSRDHRAAAIVQTVFASDKFRVYVNDDPIGTELGGTLKNVIAIAAGVCDGLHLGTNAKAALITRALAEIIRVGTHLGGQPTTFFGLSGLGDLLATCSSALSRNYRVGYGLAIGQSLEQVLSELRGTAEGVSTTIALVKLADREQIPVPVSLQVYRLLQQEITPNEAVEALMERDLKHE